MNNKSDGKTRGGNRRSYFNFHEPTPTTLPVLFHETICHSRFFPVKAAVTVAAACGLLWPVVQVHAGPGGPGQVCNPRGSATMCYHGQTIYNVSPSTQAFYLNSGATCGACSASDAAALAYLVLSAGAISPVFAPGTYAYTLSISNAASSTTVTPFVADAYATVRVNDVPVASGTASSPIPLSVGQNTIDTVVTAQNNLFTNTYTVTVTVMVPTLNLQITQVYPAVYDPVSSSNSLTVDFVSDPNQTVLLEYSTDLQTWTSLGNFDTTAIGAFEVTVTAGGDDQAAVWNSAMFFRGTKQ
jgi:hypothetical protein